MSPVLSPVACLAIVFGGSMVSLSVPLLTDSYEALLLAFCVFECLLGVYWPAIALVRSAEVSDAQRASTMAVFRVLLNALVVGVLLVAGRLPESVVFGLAAVMLAVCLACTRTLDGASDAPRGLNLQQSCKSEDHTGAEGSQLIHKQHSVAAVTPADADADSFARRSPTHSRNAS